MEVYLNSADYYRELHNKIVSIRTKKGEFILKRREIKDKICSKLLDTINTFPENELVNVKLTKITEKSLDNTSHPLNIKIDTSLIPIAKSIIREVFSNNVGITKTGLINFKKIFTIDDIKDVEFRKLLFNKINETNLNKIISNLNKAISYRANYIVLNVTTDICWDLLKTKLYKLRYIIEEGIIKDSEEDIVKISF